MLKWTIASIMMIEIKFIKVQNAQKLEINKEKLSNQDIYNVYGSENSKFVC